jgi:hypothetical protein
MRRVNGPERGRAAGEGDGRTLARSVRWESRAAARAAAIAAACLAAIAATATPAFAQLDPLLFLKTTKPNVLLVVDTANRMQRDANGDYHDPFVYPRAGQPWEPVLGVTAANAAAAYRRKYVGLRNLDTSLSADKFAATTITSVGDLEAGFAAFEATTRLGVARLGLARAVAYNQGVARFGLLKMRQANARLGAMSNEGPVFVEDPLQQGVTDGWAGRWRITWPIVDDANGHIAAITAPVVRADSATANADVRSSTRRSSTCSSTRRPKRCGSLPPMRARAATRWSCW